MIKHFEEIGSEKNRTAPGKSLSAIEEKALDVVQFFVEDQRSIHRKAAR